MVLRGPGHALPENFEILHCVMVFLVFFEQILIKLFAPHSESFTKYDAICPHIFDLCVLTSGQEWIRKILVGDAIFKQVECLLL